MKPGDLVKVAECPKSLHLSENGWLNKCDCFFCAGKSNRIGYVTGPAPRNSWHVMFDCGAWRLDDFEEARGEVKVIKVING